MTIDVTTNGSSTNGSRTSAAAAAPAATLDVITALRKRPRNVHLAGGFGPLLVGIVLFLLMLWLAPSVAPERIVERPVSGSTTTVVVATTTIAPTTTVPTTTVAP